MVNYNYKVHYISYNRKTSKLQYIHNQNQTKLPTKNTKQTNTTLTYHHQGPKIEVGKRPKIEVG